MMMMMIMMMMMTKMKIWVLSLEVLFVPATAVVIEKALVRNNFFTRCVSNLVTPQSAAAYGILSKIFPEE